MRRARAGLIAVGISLTFAGAARADVERSWYGSEGGSHVFKDDPLHAGVSISGGEKIKVRPIANRVRLIRPRASFVMEMFKSVEKM
jgi:hypothetical protein